MNYKYKTLLVFLISILTSCINSPHIINSKVLVNSSNAKSQPYLILISLDGFRWDYVEKFKPHYLSQFIKNGVSSESLIPSYPSKTFPNHYTIATGLYPDKHGIISNKFYSPDLRMNYSINKLETAKDGRFYGGVPIWVHAAQSGFVTASYFFLGSEAEINGIRPTYYYSFDYKTLKQTKVNQVLKWLKLSESERPHFISLYFHDMDKVGHWYGPDDEDKLKSKLYELDAYLGDLFKGVSESKLPVNIMIVSDHGMKNVSIENYISIEPLMGEELYSLSNNGAMVNIYPYDDSDKEAILLKFKQMENSYPFKVYTIETTPSFEYKPQHKNWGAIQIIPDQGYYFSSKEGIEGRKNSGRNIFGQHGFDPKDKDMHGIFYANGPAFKKGYKFSSIKNIHLYPLMCKILGLSVPEHIDGKLNQIESVLLTD